MNNAVLLFSKSRSIFLEKIMLVDYSVLGESNSKKVSRIASTLYTSPLYRKQLIPLCMLPCIFIIFYCSFVSLSL